MLRDNQIFEVDRTKSVAALSNPRRVWLENPNLKADAEMTYANREIRESIMPDIVSPIGVSPTAHQSSSDEVKSSGSDAVVVKSQGQQIETQPTQGSLIQQAISDSAEEVTMAFQDQSADRLKRRDAKSGSASRINKLLQKYLKGVNSVGAAEKFEKLSESLKQLTKPTPQQIRDLIEKFGDSTDEETSTAGVLLALEELFSTEPPENGVLEAIRQVKSEVGKELRSFYQETVKTCKDLSEVYDQLLGEYGEKDFLSATDSLITRLGEDLQAEGTSVDSNKVKATVDSLYHLEVARNTFSSFAGLVNKMNAVFTPGKA